MLALKYTQPGDLFSIGTISMVVVKKAAECRFERLKTAWSEERRICKTEQIL